MASRLIDILVRSKDFNKALKKKEEKFEILYISQKEIVILYWKTK